MKANQKFLHDEKGQVGIGTMIVFIATVLVAAVAAGVLINVSGDLQSKSLSTGKAATENVASNLKITSVNGDRDRLGGCTNDCGAADLIEDLHVRVQLAAGSSAIELQNLKISVDDGTSIEIYEYNVAGGAGTFTTTDETGGTDTLLEAGETYLLTVELDGPDEIDQGQTVYLDLIPDVGTPVGVNFPTPTAFDSYRYVDLWG